MVQLIKCILEFQKEKRDRRLEAAKIKKIINDMDNQFFADTASDPFASTWEIETTREYQKMQSEFEAEQEAQALQAEQRAGAAYNKGLWNACKWRNPLAYFILKRG